MPTRSQVPKAATALLLVDVINPFDFPGGPAVARRSMRVATRLASLRDRASRAGLPVVYVNDNFGLWRSNLFVLKPTLSGFYQTPLQLLLRLAGARTVIVTGLMADNCVLFTAADAYMRDYKLIVPRDCVTSNTAAATQRALTTMTHLFGARTDPSAALRLSRR
jgi:nicotinamidase-related amidase